MVGAEPRACVSCGHALTADAVFCSACGTRQPTLCTSCGAGLDDEARFCSRCGASVVTWEPAAPEAVTPAAREPVAERRLASVLFADLVGFTTLSESRDPEQVRELLSGYFDRCRHIIASYDGAVEKFIGDAVMAVWGVPTAHEDDAERAVRAGVDLAAMVTALGDQLGADLALRVGVVTGEVAATLGATTQGMVAGDPVNTAARVQTAAEPGRVYVDAATRSLTAAVADYDDAGEHTLKGKAEPEQLFAVRALDQASPDRPTVRAAMVGRDHEFALLREVFASVAEQHRPRLVVLDGEPGVGKSRLVEEFEAWLTTLPERVRWHRGRCLSYGEGIAFRALADAVRSRLSLTDAEDPTTARECLDHWLSEQSVSDVDAADMRAALAQLLDLPDAPGDRSRGELFAAWTRWLEVVGRGDPVVFVIDDAHHADDGLLDFVDHVLVTTRTPLLVVAMARPELLERRSGWGGRRATAIPLGPLDDSSMRALVDDLLTSATPAQREALRDRVGGIPLYAIETVRSLLDTGVAAATGHGIILNPAAADLGDTRNAPDSLRSLIRARLDALDEPERDLVATASVLGLSFTPDALSTLAPDAAVVDAGVRTLLRREVLTRDSDPHSPDRGQLRFSHALVQNVAYGTLSRRDRMQRHLAAASYFGSLEVQGSDLDALIADHLVDAYEASFPDDAERPIIAAQAVQHLITAAERAGGLGAPGQARRFYERAAQLCADEVKSAQLRVDAAFQANNAGDHEDALRLTSAALPVLEQTEERRDVVRAVAERMRAFKWLEQLNEVLRLSDVWLDRLVEERSDDAALIGLMDHVRVGAQWFGDTERTSRIEHLQIQVSADTTDPHARLDLLTIKAIRLLQDGDIDGAAELAQQFLDESEDWQLFTPRCAAYGVLVDANLPRDLARAVAYGRLAVAAARREGLRANTQEEIGHLSLALFLLGDLLSMNEILAELEPDDLGRLTGSFIAMLDHLASWATGADPRVWPDGPTSHSTPDSFCRDIITCADTLRLGRAGNAADAAGSAIDWLVTSGDYTSTLTTLPLLSEVTVRLGDIDLARRVLAASYVVGLDPALPLVRSMSAFTRGRLAPLLGSGDGTDDLRRAIQELDAYGAVGYAALARLDLAERIYDATEAASLREDAVTTLDRIGAYGWIPTELSPRRA